MCQVSEVFCKIVLQGEKYLIHKPKNPFEGLLSVCKTKVLKNHDGFVVPLHLLDLFFL